MLPPCSFNAIDLILYIIYNIHMYKIVLDTNVVLSAMFSSGGASFKLLSLLIDQAEERRFYNVVSVPLVMEFEEVLLRSKNRDKYPYFDEKELRLIISDIVAISYQTKLHFLWRPFLKDTFDDKVLETAVNGGAKAIVTFNTKDFEGVQKMFNIAIVTPKELFEKGIL